MGKKRREVRKEERTPATPETLAKLTPDPLRQMVEGGLIGSDEERAASEIRAIYMAVCRGLFSKAGRLGEEFGIQSGRAPDMPTGLAIAHRETYLPWTRSHKPAVIDLVLSLIVERDPVHILHRADAATALKDYASSMTARKIIDISAA